MTWNSLSTHFLHIFWGITWDKVDMSTAKENKKTSSTSQIKCPSVFDILSPYKTVGETYKHKSIWSSLLKKKQHLHFFFFHSESSFHDYNIHIHFNSSWVPLSLTNSWLFSWYTLHDIHQLVSNLVFVPFWFQAGFFSQVCFFFFLLFVFVLGTAACC